MTQSFPVSPLYAVAICGLLLTFPFPPHAAGQQTAKVGDSHAESGERWFVIHSAAGKVGHAVLRWQLKDGHHHWSQEMQLRMDRFGDAVLQHVALISVEDESGSLLQFESTVSDGNQTQRIEGARSDDRLEFTTTVGEDRRSQAIERVGDCRGFFAMEQSLTERPMEAGERREIRSLIPLVTIIANTSMVAKGWETTPLQSGSRRLLRIDCAVQIDKQHKIDFIVWTDRAGVVMKNHVPAIQQTTYVASREQATSSENKASFDIGALASLPVANLTGDPHAADSAVYRFRSQAGDLAWANVIPIGASQRVTLRPDGSADVRVSRVRPTSASEKAKKSSVGGHVPDDLASNQLIDNDDPEIIALSRQAAVDSDDPWQIAVALERLVFDTITDKSFARTFDSASSVARTRAGDCTEHAVLLAALCRARGIPARFVAGLVHVKGQQAFGMHAWTEAWIDDRWIALDATMARGGVGAGHIKICDSNLANANAAAATLPVSVFLGKALSIECVELNIP